MTKVLSNDLSDVEMELNVSNELELRGGDLTASAAEPTPDLVQLCEMETAAIKAQEHDVNLYTKLFYDALLEFLNEASDVFLTLQLYKYSSEDNENQRLARGLFHASLFFLCFEFLMRTLTKAFFDFTRPWVPIGVNGALKRPQLRTFKSEASTITVIFAVVVSIFEPNVGSVLLELVEDEDMNNLPKARESEPEQIKEFYKLYSQEVERLNSRRELFWLFALEDVPELIIEILLVLNLDRQELSTIWWLSTMSTLLHLFRHTVEYAVGRRLLYKLKAKVPAVFREPGQLKQVGFTIKQLRERHSYSLDDCRTSGFSLDDFGQKAGYSASDRKLAGYSAKECRDAGYISSADDCKVAGYSAEDCKEAGYSAKDCKEAGYSVIECKEAGYSVIECKAAGYFSSALDYKAAGYSAIDCKAAGYFSSAFDCKAAGYSAIDCKAVGYNAKDCKEAGYSAKDCREAGYFSSATDCIAAGYSANDCKEAGYFFSVIDCKAAGYSATDCKAAGYSAKECKLADYSAVECKAAGYSAIDCKEAGYFSSAKDCKAAGYSAIDCKEAGYSAKDCKAAGYSVKDCKEAGYFSSAIDCKVAGYSAKDCKAAGYISSATDCKAVDYSARECKAAGCSAAQCKAAGYSSEEIIVAFDLKGTSAIVRTFGLRKLNKKDVSERRIGVQVFCEGKVGKITKYHPNENLWDCIQITYTDGTRNKAMISEDGTDYLIFTPRVGYSGPTEDVWVGF